MPLPRIANQRIAIASAPAMRWRTDFVSAGIIDRCLALQVTHGTVCAARLLCEHRIDIDVALRILAGGRRRLPLTQAVGLPRTYLNPPPLIYRHTHY